MYNQTICNKFNNRLCISALPAHRDYINYNDNYNRSTTVRQLSSSAQRLCTYPVNNAALHLSLVFTQEHTVYNSVNFHLTGLIIYDFRLGPYSHDEHWVYSMKFAINHERIYTMYVCIYLYNNTANEQL